MTRRSTCKSRVYKKGDLYGARPGGVWIISPEWKHHGTIEVPETVSNLTRALFADYPEAQDKEWLLR